MLATIGAVVLFVAACTFLVLTYLIGATHCSHGGCVDEIDEVRWVGTSIVAFVALSPAVMMVVATASGTPRSALAWLAGTLAFELVVAIGLLGGYDPTLKLLLR